MTSRLPHWLGNPKAVVFMIRTPCCEQSRTKFPSQEKGPGYLWKVQEPAVEGHYALQGQRGGCADK